MTDSLGGDNPSYRRREPFVITEHIRGSICKQPGRK
jgi:hypothetical protein